MKFLIIIILFLKFSCFAQNPKCDKLPNGTYWVYFKNSMYDEYKLTITDTSFNQIYKNGDSAKGKVSWLYSCKFRLEYFKYDSIQGPLKIIYDSWGKPCIELNDVRGDTIMFRTTHPGNLHVTVNEGYFVKQKDF
jgi:hypothetical protein